MTKSEKNTECSYDKVPTRENLKELDKELPAEYGYGVRHVQLVIFLMCLSASFIARAHLGVTIVAMTEEDRAPAVEIPPNITLFEVKGNITDVFERIDNFNILNDFTNDSGFEAKNYTAEVNRTVEIDVSDDIWNIYKSYDWPVPYQETILGAFFLGYCIMMIPIGIICQKWGGKVPYQISLFTNGIVSILTPWLTAWGGWKAVCGCRIVQGMAQAGTFPGTQALLSKWVPGNELASLSSYVYTGSTIGSVIGFQLGGLLADSSWGWQSTYWVVGVICIAAGVVLTIFGAASPVDHKFISEEEKFYILSRIDGDGLKRQHVPWRAILRSKYVWASVSTHLGSAVSFVFFFTQVPSFIHHIYGTDVKKSGILTSLPYLASFFTSVAYGVLTDFFVNRNIVTPKTARRVCNSLSQYGIGICLILASFANTSTLAVISLVFAMAFHMGIHTGWLVNQIDIAPNYTGSLMAFGNTVSNVFILLIPVAVSNIVTDVKNQHQWQIMFGMVAALAIITNTVFIIFLSTETQPWNDYEGPASKDKEILEKNELAAGREPIK